MKHTQTTKAKLLILAIASSISFSSYSVGIETFEAESLPIELEKAASSHDFYLMEVYKKQNKANLPNKPSTPIDPAKPADIQTSSSSGPSGEVSTAIEQLIKANEVVATKPSLALKVIKTKVRAGSTVAIEGLVEGSGFSKQHGLLLISPDKGVWHWLSFEDPRVKLNLSEKAQGSISFELVALTEDLKLVRSELLTLNILSPMTSGSSLLEVVNPNSRAYHVYNPTLNVAVFLKDNLGKMYEMSNQSLEFVHLSSTNPEIKGPIDSTGKLNFKEPGVYQVIVRATYHDENEKAKHLFKQFEVIIDPHPGKVWAKSCEKYQDPKKTKCAKFTQVLTEEQLDYATQVRWNSWIDENPDKALALGVSKRDPLTLQVEDKLAE